MTLKLINSFSLQRLSKGTSDLNEKSTKFLPPFSGLYCFSCCAHVFFHPITRCYVLFGVLAQHLSTSRHSPTAYHFLSTPPPLLEFMRLGERLALKSQLASGKRSRIYRRIVVRTSNLEHQKRTLPPDQGSNGLSKAARALHSEEDGSYHLKKHA